MFSLFIDAIICDAPRIAILVFVTLVIVDFARF